MITVAIVLTNVVGGGTKRYADEIVEAWKRQGHRIIYVQVVERIIHIRILEVNFKDRNIFLFNDTNLTKLTKILESYNIQLLHMQHLLNADIKFFSLHRKLKVPFVITLHDYYSICPFIKLTDINDMYCGEIGEINCSNCLKNRCFYSYTFGEEIKSILKWRKFWQRYLAEAAFVIVPSRDMEKRIHKYFTNIRVRIFENPEIINFNKIKCVGLIGTLSDAKGGKKVKECIEYITKHKIPIKFIVFGEIPDYAFTKVEQQYIKILGAYEEKNIYELITKYNIDFFWFPGVWPETYSYTLSIPIRLKIPCLSTNIGAIAERITANKWGKTYLWNAETEEIVKKLVLFDFDEYKNKDFEIKNRSFGDFFNFYDSIKFNEIKINSSNLLNYLKKYSEINTRLTKSEFMYLWKNSNIRRKWLLLKWLRLKWLISSLKKLGIKKFIRKLINTI